MREDDKVGSIKREKIRRDITREEKEKSSKDEMVSVKGTKKEY